MKTRRFLSISSLTIAMVLLVGCDSQQSDALDDLLYMEQPGYEGQEVSEQRIDELKQSIERFRETVNRKVEAAGRLGEYHKLLANAYIDRQMYQLALQSLQEAIRIEPENPQLFYLAGVSAARTAKALVSSPQEQERLFSDAEAYYRRAIELRPDHTDARYGLAVLYVFELNQPSEGIPHLERIVERQQRNARALSVLARAYAATGRPTQAAETYGRAAEVATDPQVREQARANQRQLLEGSGQGTSR